jgi:hypothetical protein
MNQGFILLATIVGTVGVAIVAVVYRDLIFPSAAPAGRPRPRPRPKPRPAARPAPAETKPKQVESVSAPVSPIAITDNDAEMVAYIAIATLIEAQLITETAALTTVFNVRPGSSKAYQESRAKLKHAQQKIAEQKITKTA